MLAGEVREGDRVLARWDGVEHKVVLEPQAAEAAKGAASGDHRNAIQANREAQHGAGEAPAAAAE